MPGGLLSRTAAQSVRRLDRRMKAVRRSDLSIITACDVPHGPMRYTTGFNGGANQEILSQ